MYPHSFYEWLKRPLFSMIDLCRNSIQSQLADTKQAEISSALKRVDNQLLKIKKAALSSESNPISLYHWLNEVIGAQKRCFSWLKTCSPSISLASIPCSEMENQEKPLLRVPIGKHTLPPLPYPYHALEPYIDEKTMRIHHDELHKKYVEDLNKAEVKLQDSRKTGNFDLIKHWERELAFNGAGHYLHTIFWDTMIPNGGGKPTGSLLKEIQLDFGSFEAFKKQFSLAAEKVEGGGWAILVWSPRPHRLEILTAEKHQNLTQWDVIPLLPLDVWEHAYYLKYPNQRKKYIHSWWNLVNWKEVEHRWRIARQVAWKPY